MVLDCHLLAGLIKIDHSILLWVPLMPGKLPERSEGVGLIRRMAGGDRHAFSDFYDRYAPLTLGLIRRIVGNEAEAEDVLQEVFWQVWQEAARYDERRGGPEAWLLNRARSRAIDKLRSIRRIGETFVAPVDEGIAREPAGTMGNVGTLAEDRDMVRTALALLPEPQRQVIELAFLGGLTQSEIASRLRQPLGTIKTRIRAGLERLRGHFRASGGGTS
jgi:RNA polymerase sigma-70 factor (ECF subfamily)